jgi:hypothetical protein
MDDSHDNFMTDMIASGINTIATFTDEDCSQADMYLNIPPNEDVAAPVIDTITNIEDNSRNNEESLVDESIEMFPRGIIVHIFLTSILRY